MSAHHPSLYRHAGGGMLRAAMLALPDSLSAWPRLSDLGSCREWLGDVWALPGFAAAARYASGSFAALVDEVLAEKVTDGRKVRKVTLSVIRYLLRMAGRATPFGLFAGVAPVEVGPDAQVVWGVDHHAVIRADTLWLDGVLERLERLPALLPRLDVVSCDLIVDRGGRVEMPRGPGRVSVRNTRVVRLIRDLAAAPIAFRNLSSNIAEAFPGIPTSRVHEVLESLVAQGMLITSLRAPMTVIDPLGYLIDAIDRAVEGAPTAEIGEVSAVLADLRDIAGIIGAHNTAVDPDAQTELRSTVSERMRRFCTVGRTTIAGDLHLDCRVTVPDELAREMAHAVAALVRLTRQPRPDPAWNGWCREFCDRYGAGSLVPVTEAVHPDAGIGMPAGFPASMWAEPEDTVIRRDEELLRLAWEALADGRSEVVLTDEIITEITADDPINSSAIPAHVELSARVHAASTDALRRGEYTFTVHPGWGFGTLTSRFGPVATRAGLDRVYAAAPAAVDGALSVQLSFPPLFPHSENVVRLPAYLPDVLPLGEHRPGDDPGDDPAVIRLDDVGIVAAADGLHLVSISRRRIIDPQVFHALALPKQAPPLARFLATLTRGFLARYTEFDWGPQATRLPFLPRVRHRRAILSPARWRITAADHAAMAAGDGSWEQALTRWRQRWGCPDTVELHADHRCLRLTLTVDAHLTLLREHLDKHGDATVTETEPAAGTGWIGGHVHEIVMPFSRAATPMPNRVSGPLPVVTNAASTHLPASPQSAWLYAQVFTHSERLDDIIRAHLPRLLATIDDPVYWFARYRGVHETDHLRLRIRVTSPDRYAAVASAVGRWGQQLSDIGAASRLALATYRPEAGRYGSGPAMQAAEVVFAADSRAVALAANLLPPQVIHPVALTAIGLVDIADGFHPDLDAADDWLVDHLAAKTKAATAVERAVADQTAGWSAHRLLPDGTGLPAALATAWHARATALARYRSVLPDDAAPDQVLSALLHMHHNRARLIDRADEAMCLRLARQIALARRAGRARTARGAA